MSVREDYIIPYRLASRDVHRTTSNAAKYFTRETSRVASNKTRCNKSKDDAMSLTSGVSSSNQASWDTPGNVSTNKFGLQSGLCKPRNSDDRSKPTLQGNMGFCKPQATLLVRDNYAQNSDIFPTFSDIDIFKPKRPILNKVVDNARDRDKFPYFNKFTPCNCSVNCNDFANDPSKLLQGENVPDRNRSICNLEHQESKCTNKGQKLKTKRESAKSSNETVNTELDSFHFRVPSWFFGSSNTAKNRVNLEHYVEDYTHFAQLSELPVNPEHQTAEGNSQIKMFSSNLSRKDFREDNHGQTPLNLKCIDNCSHCPSISSNWRTLPMESDLQKYLSLKERKKGRCMTFPKYIRPVDIDKLKLAGTNWQPRQDHPTLGLFEKQKTRFGYKNLYKHRDSVCVEVQNQRDRTYDLHSKMKTILREN